MKIEIVDRELWLRKIDIALGKIIGKRVEEDAKFISWYQKKHSVSWFGLIRKKPEDVLPPVAYWEIGRMYPSTRYHADETRLLDMKRALLSEGTNRVYITEHDLNALESWQ